VGEAKRRPIFDVIENPEKGWKCVLIQLITSADDEEGAWRVQIRRESDGMIVGADNPMLFVAWARATEKAHMEDNGI